MKNAVKSDEMILVSKTEYDSMKQQLAWFMEQLKLSKHKQFGSSSEKSDYSQLTLFDVDSVEVPEPEIEEIKNLSS